MTKKAIFEYLDRVEFLDERFYRFTNTETGEILFYPSSTFILKSFPMDYGLLQWFKDVGNEAERIANRASDSGTKVHNEISKLLNGENVVWDDRCFNLEEWQGLIRFLDFFKEYKPKTRFNEKIVFSHKHKYAGTIDYLCEIGEETWLIDFKFSNAIHDSYFLQLASYKNAIEETLNIKVDKMAILHLKAKNKKGWVLSEPKEDYDKLFNIFLKTQDLFLFTNPNCCPKNLTYPNILSLKEI
jgi:hypothetical protein